MMKMYDAYIFVKEMLCRKNDVFEGPESWFVTIKLL